MNKLIHFFLWRKEAGEQLPRVRAGPGIIKPTAAAMPRLVEQPGDAMPRQIVIITAILIIIGLVSFTTNFQQQRLAPMQASPEAKFSVETENVGNDLIVEPTVEKIEHGDEVRLEPEEGTRMATYDDDWLLDEQVCPADIHLTEWLEKEKVRNKTIYHFGTGGHHKLGMWNLQHQDKANNVLGITASKKEFEHFIELATKNPTLSRQYQVYFGDIYVLNQRLLPQIDIASLFHLSEFRDHRQDAYGGLTDKQVVEVVLKALPKDGKVLVYTGSFAYATAKDILDELIAEGYCHS